MGWLRASRLHLTVAGCSSRDRDGDERVSQSADRIAKVNVIMFVFLSGSPIPSHHK
tara:strand:- start:1191 stop:1358 length:168 start_codon:yes stop_codon:yes gene_type:complete